MKIHQYDVWNFSSLHDLLGDKHPGQIPGQLVVNVLFHFTNPGDLIVDPMAGGGVTLDSCLITNRKCMAFDINPKREDIKEHDITAGYPDIPKADLIFLDPPYFKKKADEYDLSEELRSKEGFVGFAKDWVNYCIEGLKNDGITALLISDYIDYDNPKQSIFSDEYAQLFEEQGFIRLYKISCPLSTQQYQAHDVEKAKEEHKLLIRGRELYILKNHG